MQRILQRPSPPPASPPWPAIALQKIVQQPQLRSLNGQKASLKIGSRVPTATGSTQSGIAGVSVSGLNTTQFQYLDVGVNVDITPYIHPDGDVTLKIMLDVSSVTSYVSIGGISEPEIGQRKVEHEIRLKDGEVNLLGGMLEHTDTKSPERNPRPVSDSHRKILLFRERYGSDRQ